LPNIRCHPIPRAGTPIITDINVRCGDRITPTVRARDHANCFGSPRRDLRLGWLARAEWTPDWRRRINPEAELDFAVAFLRNRSTLSSANYSDGKVARPCCSAADSDAPVSLSAASIRLSRVILAAWVIRPVMIRQVATRIVVMRAVA
jgi:hypothetical protein